MQDEDEEVMGGMRLIAYIVLFLVSLGAAGTIWLISLVLNSYPW